MKRHPKRLRRHPARFMVVLAGAIGGFALACTHPAAAQQASQPTAESDPDGIVVAAPPNRPASVELATVPPDVLSGATPNGAEAQPKTPAKGLSGYIDGGVGTNGMRAMGGGLSLPLAGDKLQLSIEGYGEHFGGR